MKRGIKSLGHALACCGLQYGVLSASLAIFSTTLLADLQQEKTFDQLLLDWQAAYLIGDEPSHLKVSRELFEKTPNAFHASLLLRSLSKANQIEKAIELLLGPYKQEMMMHYPEALKDFAWQTLHFHMQGVAVDQISLILDLLHLVRDIRMAPLVIEALAHEDLRLNMQALDLVESYPLDAYRVEVMQLWKRSSNTLLKARVFSLAAHLKWPESEEMSQELKRGSDNLGRELIIPLAEYEMSQTRLEVSSLETMVMSPSIIPARMAAWCLRYQPTHEAELAKIYRLVFTRKDSLANLLALDTLLHFHRPLYEVLKEDLEELQKQWAGSLIESQVRWIRAVALGKQARFEWVQESLSAKESIGSSQIAWALALRFEDHALMAYLWNNRVYLKNPIQLQSAWAIIQTRSKQGTKEVQEAIAFLKKWILKGPNYWSQDSDWPGLIQLRDKPPSWMPTAWIREAASQLRLKLLLDLSLTEGELAYNLLLELYQKEPEVYLSSLMSLAWSQGRSLDMPFLAQTKEAKLLRAMTGVKEEDKRLLQKEFFNSSEAWKQQIMHAMLQLADQSDLDFFVSCMRQSPRLSIKSTSGILIALRQGTRPKSVK